MTALSPLPATPADSARRVFRCLMFIDVAGSLRLTRQVGDERAFEMVTALGAIVRGAAEERGGRVARGLGDGFLVSFGTVHQALETAVLVQQEVRDLVPAEPPIRLRVGVHADYLIEDAGDLFGLAVYLASRVTAHAHGGEILLTEAARDLVADAGYRLHDFGPTLLPGFEKPVRIFELKWAAGDAAEGD